MKKTLTREVIETIVNRALTRLTEDERCDLSFDTFEERYNYEDNLSIYTPVKPALEHFAKLLDVDVNDLAIFLNPYNVLEYEEDIERIF